MLAQLMKSSLYTINVGYNYEAFAKAYIDVKSVTSLSEWSAHVTKLALRILMYEW